MNLESERVKIVSRGNPEASSEVLGVVQRWISAHG